MHEYIEYPEWWNAASQYRKIKWLKDSLNDALAEVESVRSAIDHMDINLHLSRVVAAFGVRSVVAEVILRLYHARGSILSVEALNASLRNGKKDRLEVEADNIITVYVAYARRAIGKDAIINHPKTGYSMSRHGLLLIDSIVNGVREAAE